MVRAAQKAALRVAHRGMRARDVDKTAREVIRAGIQDFRVKTRERRRFSSPSKEVQEWEDSAKEDGFDVNDYFTHRLGHGEFPHTYTALIYRGLRLNPGCLMNRNRDRWSRVSVSGRWRFQPSYLGHQQQ